MIPEHEHSGKHKHYVISDGDGRCIRVGYVTADFIEDAGREGVENYLTSMADAVLS